MFEFCLKSFFVAFSYVIWLLVRCQKIYWLFDFISNIYSWNLEWAAQCDSIFISFYVRFSIANLKRNLKFSIRLNSRKRFPIFQLKFCTAYLKFPSPIPIRHLPKSIRQLPHWFITKSGVKATHRNHISVQKTLFVFDIRSITRINSKLKFLTNEFPKRELETW